MFSSRSRKPVPVRICFVAAGEDIMTMGSFNGKVLDDDWNTAASPEKPKITVKSEQLSPASAPAMHPLPFPPLLIPRRILIVFRLSSRQRPTVEIELNGTVEQLKHKINEIEDDASENADHPCSLILWEQNVFYLATEK